MSPNHNSTLSNPKPQTPNPKPPNPTLNPLKVSPIVKEHGRSRLEVNIKLKAQFDPTLFALNVIVKIPLPSNTGKPQTPNPKPQTPNPKL